MFQSCQDGVTRTVDREAAEGSLSGRTHATGMERLESIIRNQWITWPGPAVHWSMTNQDCQTMAVNCEAQAERPCQLRDGTFDCLGRLLVGVPFSVSSDPLQCPPHGSQGYRPYISKGLSHPWILQEKSTVQVPSTSPQVPEASPSITWGSLPHCYLTLRFDLSRPFSSS